MITAIREVRRARKLTLEDVATRCVPPTTAQTIGRLETGTRTVSVGWLNRIAAALGVETSDLVRLPGRIDLPVAAVLDRRGADAPRHPRTATPPQPSPGQIAVLVATDVGAYRSGDEIWCDTLNPVADPTVFAGAMHHDVLVPQPGGRFAFGRLIGIADDTLTILPPGSGEEPVAIAAPPWIARATRLVRML